MNTQDNTQMVVGRVVDLPPHGSGGVGTATVERCMWEHRGNRLVTGCGVEVEWHRGLLLFTFCPRCGGEIEMK